MTPGPAMDVSTTQADVEEVKEQVEQETNNLEGETTLEGAEQTEMDQVKVVEEIEPTITPEIESVGQDLDQGLEQSGVGQERVGVEEAVEGNDREDVVAVEVVAKEDDVTAVELTEQEAEVEQVEPLEQTVEPEVVETVEEMDETGFVEDVEQAAAGDVVETVEESNEAEVVTMEEIAECELVDETEKVAEVDVVEAVEETDESEAVKVAEDSVEGEVVEGTEQTVEGEVVETVEQTVEAGDVETAEQTDKKEVADTIAENSEPAVVAMEEMAEHVADEAMEQGNGVETVMTTEQEVDAEVIGEAEEADKPGVVETVEEDAEVEVVETVEQAVETEVSETTEQPIEPEVMAAAEKTSEPEAVEAVEEETEPQELELAEPGDVEEITGVDKGDVADEGEENVGEGDEVEVKPQSIAEMSEVTKVVEQSSADNETGVEQSIAEVDERDVAPAAEVDVAEAAPVTEQIAEADVSDVVEKSATEISEANGADMVEHSNAEVEEEKVTPQAEQIVERGVVESGDVDLNDVAEDQVAPVQDQCTSVKSSEASEAGAGQGMDETEVIEPSTEGVIERDNAERVETDESLAIMKQSKGMDDGPVGAMDNVTEVTGSTGVVKETTKDGGDSVELQDKASLKTAMQHGRAQMPISIARRFCVATGWTIFGLLFYYIVMVGLSTISPSIIIARVPRHGWARTASRQTASVATLTLVRFMTTDPSTMSSLMWAVMLGCATFCHVVIVASDVRAYVDEEVLKQMMRVEDTHFLMGMLPLWGIWVLGTIGWVAVLVIVNERVYGHALRDRRKELPKVSRVLCGWLVGHNMLYYVDLLIWVARKEKRELWEVLYPLFFMSALIAGVSYRNVQRCLHTQANISTEKKTQ